VQIFREQGGIPMCKTGIPQTLLAFECANPIFGTTSNPYSSARTCGGSSGGEAALITLRGTPLGWGSDSELNFVVERQLTNSRRLAPYSCGILWLLRPEARCRSLAGGW